VIAPHSEDLLPPQLDDSLLPHLEDLLKNRLTGFVKEKLEWSMKEEIRNFIHVKQTNKRSSHHGYFERTLDTWYGKMDDYKLHVIATGIPNSSV